MLVSRCSTFRAIVHLALVARAVLAIWLGACSATAAAAPPNVVLIYADDLGYGDLGCYGATKIATPNVDRLAREGLRFTDAHSAAATCTPSRYSLMTGEYAWRRKGTGILPGDARLIIEPGRATLPAILHNAGYACAAVGKWHLGLGNGNIDWNGEIRPGPLEIGFDHAFIIPATGDRVPCVYVRDHRVVDLDPNDPISVRFDRPIGDEPTGRERPDLLTMKPSHGHDQTIVNGISRIGYMAGGASARWSDEDMAARLADEATAFIDRAQGKPFFLYFANHDIHVPRVAAAPFAGKSGMGPRGDVILQFDWCVGRILEALDRNGIADDTLVLLSSDNGPVIDDGYQDEAVSRLSGHTPAGPLRGGKYSAFEGGTRVPFLARWPARIKPGVSNALICQIDLLASMAALTSQETPAAEGHDGVNVLPALLGENSTGRESLVEQANVLSLRQGTWKLIEPGKGPAINAQTNTEMGVAPTARLFDLSTDLGEQVDLADKYPERVAEMTRELARIRGLSPASK